MARILPTHTPALFDAAVARAAELLRAGELVALPTETVYGLAANALDARAVARIFEVKGDRRTIRSSCTSPARKWRVAVWRIGRRWPSSSPDLVGRGR